MRRLVLAALVSLLIVSAGCTGLITGETVEFDASPATVDDATLESTGYEETNTSEQTVTRDVEFAGQERTIRIVNQLAQYTRDGSIGPIEIPELSRFVVVSSPGATAAGQTLNPAADWSNREVLDQLPTGQITDIERDGNRTTQSLGDSRTVGMFTGTTEMQGQEVDMRMHVASFEHEGDVIIILGVHPEQINEEEAVDELFGGLEHSGN